MGNYINLGNKAFLFSRSTEYVDKSGLISVVNSTINTRNCFSCVTRCRRFGKSMAAEMLCAYYDCSCDSRSLFEDLEIAKDPSFEEHLNKYPVIYLDVSEFVTEIKDNTIVSQMREAIKADIHNAYPDVPVLERESLMNFLMRICELKEQKFFFIIDEWDAVCREFEDNKQVMDEYVDWLRRLFKSGQALRVFAGVYMTGILPIKRYKTESALNNFR
ncbi:MAG: AAA family ATPase, partial [Spirochaetales bacterium]|nr:AAA family ATPase [Spirochaetales bacterium]